MTIRPDLGALGGSRALPDSLSDVLASDRLLDLIGARRLGETCEQWPGDVGDLELALVALAASVDADLSVPAPIPAPAPTPAPAFTTRREARESASTRRLGHRWIGVAVGGVLALTGGSWAAAASSDPASVHGPLGPVVRALHPDWQAHLRAEQRAQILGALAVASAQSASGQRIDAAATYGAARAEASQLKGGPDAEVTARLNQVGQEIGVSTATGSATGIPAALTGSAGSTAGTDTGSTSSTAGSTDGGTVSGAAPVGPAPVSTTSPSDPGTGSTSAGSPPVVGSDPPSDGSGASPSPGDGSTGDTNSSLSSPTPSPSPGSTVGTGSDGSGSGGTGSDPSTGSDDPTGGTGSSAVNLAAPTGDDPASPPTAGSAAAGSGSASDAGTADSGTSDAGTSDAGTSDAGASATDGGPAAG